MGNINEKIKGFRGLITLWSTVIVGQLEAVIELVQNVVATIGPQLDENGALMALVTAAMTVKLAVTDAWKRATGKLGK